MTSTTSIEDIYTLSPMQQGMLFHTVYASTTGIYIDQVICTLTGPLDRLLLRRTWQRLMAQHPPLRTAFLWEDLDEPLQVVSRFVETPWEEQDWRGIPLEAQRPRFYQWLEEDRARGFALEQAPLLRLTLMQMADELSYFAWTFHHMLLDGWSVSLILGDMLAVYDALYSGRESAPARSRPYRDYITWLRKQNLASAEVFWRQRLQGFTVPTPLAAERPQDLAHFAAAEDAEQHQEYSQLAPHAFWQQSQQTMRLQGIRLPVETTTALEQLARTHQLTLNTLVQGAWALLLSRYSGETDVLFGAIVAGRPALLSGVETMTGLFINTLPVRVVAPPQSILLPWLIHLQTQESAARQYEYSPLAQVQGWSELPPGQSLFESLVVFESYPIDQILERQQRNSNLHFTWHFILEQTNFPLSVIVEATEHLSILFGYNTQRFAAATIQRMLGHLSMILTSFLTHLDAPLQDIPLISAAEKWQLLTTWNPQRSSRCCADYATESDALRPPTAPPPASVLEQLHQQISCTPDAVALVWRDTQLTYAALEVRANQLAHYLQRLGVHAETLVGVYMERSPELAVALLAILKVGGVYLPIDTTYPAQRRASMLNAAHATLVLTQQRLHDSFTSDQFSIVSIESAYGESANELTTPPLTHIQPEQAAYIIFTSGSTGTPKGVIIPHRALLSYSDAVIKHYSLCSKDRVLQFAAPVFDVSLEELLPSWASGATVVLASETTAPSLSELTSLAVEQNLSVLNLPSSYWHEWVAELVRTRTALPGSLRLLIAGSEPVQPLTLMLWQRLLGDGGNVAWCNAFGLTETTITALSTKPGDTRGWEQLASIPIGRPLDNTQVYVLDSRLEPVPIGVPGDLYIGGAGLARGYLDSPALTAERFLPNPFAKATLPTTGQATERLYHTGDRVCTLPDGNLKFLGRADTQVKLRGFRIELGEIEATLLRYPGVREAVVLAREDAPGAMIEADSQRERRATVQSIQGASHLEAYIVTPHRTAGMQARLRRYLDMHLPSYMIPASLVLIEALPRLPGGKVDVQALTALGNLQPGGADAQLPRNLVAPRTPVEEILAALWAAVLGCTSVGRSDNFFKLGGHSLQAAQVIARVREALHVELPIRALYDAPMLATLAERIEEMRGRDNALVPPLRPIGRNRELPLSFAQQRLWFLDRLEPNNPFYNLPSAVRLVGKLHVAALTQSLQAVVQRHEPLRTSFPTVDGKAAQAITSLLPLPLPVVDISGLATSNACSTTCAGILNEEAQSPFDLDHGPLLRAWLLRLNAEEHVLLLTFHHSIVDGWSIGILFRELSALYAANCTGSATLLPELTVQYADYAVWQREMFQEAVLEEHLAYWRTQLAHAPTLLELPTDHPRPLIATYRGAALPFALPPTLCQELHTLSQQAGVTLFMTLLAAFSTLLLRYTGQTDILIGTPFAGRVLREVEDLVGFFVNTVVLRTDVSGNPSFSALLAQVREVFLAAYEHQDVPFEQLVDELQPERSLSYTPLFQVMFVLQNIPPVSLSLPDLRLEEVAVERGTAKYDLTLDMTEHAGTLQGSFEYNTDLFEPATIERMVGHFQRLLSGLASNPDQRLSALPLLSGLERRQMLEQWNTTQIDYPREQCIHELFETQAASTPDAIAVIFEQHHLTYRTLNERANQLAHTLCELDILSGRQVIEAELRIGLCVERSLDMVVGILGILKAGAAYVPFDPEYPRERLAFMRADAQISLVVTSLAQLAANELDTANVKTICLDRDWPSIDRYSTQNLATLVQPECLAYVIYTSGSTGTPKGVMISHGAMSNHMRWMQEAFPLTQADRVLQKTPFSFDASIWEFYAPLLVGACLVMARPGGHQDSSYLVKTLASEQITTVQLVPTMLRFLLDEPGIDSCHLLKHVFCGGEELTVELQTRCLATLPACTGLYNLYGPTECTIDTTVWACEPTDQRQRVPIGRPIANTQLYILDTHWQPVPGGVAGELYISGVNLARGYSNRPDLTAERFLPNPFSKEPGSRFYRTGDLACYRPDGVVEFLGRIDQQVKLRGFRIELEEIEETVRRHPAVQNVVVIQREDRPENRRLVAYVVTTTSTSGTSPALALSQAELRTFLQRTLPDYMIPASFVLLNALPLLSNGKVDRNRLPAPDWGQHPELAETFVAPRTQTEQTLAAIWAEVLGIERVGVYDNFFELGGDSIQIIQINARAHQANVQFLPRQMFQYQTIAALALVARVDIPLAIEQDIVTGPVPMTPIQCWFFEQEQPEPHHYNQSQLLEVGRLDAVLLEQALATLLRQHDALRLRFAPATVGWPHQYNADLHEAGTLALMCVDVTALPLWEQHHSMVTTMAELQASLNLEHGPLFRAVLFDLGASTARQLFLVAHHLVVDAVSWSILLADLETAYRQLSRKEPVQLPAKTTSYRQWAERLTELAASPALFQEADYWLTLLGKDIPKLPRDHSSSDKESNTEELTRSVSSSLGVAETHALLQEVPKAYHTQINDVLLAALAEAMRDWTGQQTVLLHLEGHGREHIGEGSDSDLSRTVGWFTTLFPVLLDITDIYEPGEVIMAVKEQVRQVPHHGIGYGLLRYLRHDSTRVAHLLAAPEAEVSFHYVGHLDQSSQESSLFKPIHESGASNCSAKARRRHMLDILGRVAGGQLRLTWTYSMQLYDRTTIEYLAQRSMEALQRLIAHCLSPDAGGHTPSDFPLARLNARALGKIAQLIEEDE